LCIIGKVYTLGRAEYGRLGLGEDCGEKREPTYVKLEGKCTAISASNSVSFALMEDGKHVFFLPMTSPISPQNNHYS